MRPPFGPVLLALFANVLLMLGAAPFGHAALAADEASGAQNPGRMTWWTQARFGMFLHWGPVSISGGELSWSRKARRPLDVNNESAGAGSDPVYDNLYKQFDPERFDAKQWVGIAQDAGMKYMVLTCKHHDGFALFHTKQGDYSIANTPFKRDIVKELSDACHAAGMRFGAYYSPRDWHNPDYGIGDNARYEAYMRNQVTELLTDYGRVDIMWWDSFGHGNSIDYWHADRFLALIRKLQPNIITNNRCSFFWEKVPVLAGDFDTPEQSIGAYQIDRPWESCITLVGGQWSYKPDGQMMSYDDVVRALASCACGDGNLLLNVGPMPDGRIEPRQVDLLRRIGTWLKTTGSSIYATHGGPFPGGSWGGATFAGDKVYLHLFSSCRTLALPPLAQRILSHRCLTGQAYLLTEADGRAHVSLDGDAASNPDTVIELTLSAPATRVAGTAEATMR